MGTSCWRDRAKPEDVAAATSLFPIDEPITAAGDKDAGEAVLLHRRFHLVLLGLKTDLVRGRGSRTLSIYGLPPGCKPGLER